MANNYLTGIIEEKTRNLKSIKVDGVWYGAFAPPMIGNFGPGDHVSFYWKEGVVNPNTGEPYRNIVGKVSGVNSGGQTQTANIRTNNSSVEENKNTPIREIGRPCLNKDRLILRQNAGTTGATITNNFIRLTVSPAEISNITFEEYMEIWLKVAKKVEEYTSGDADLAEAEALLGKELE